MTLRTTRILSQAAAAAVLLLALPALAGAVENGAPAGSRPVEERLEGLRLESEASVPAEVLEAGRQGTEEIARSGILQSALGEGASMPPFVLKDALGHEVKSSALLARGPVVIVFYRGAWCPFCNLYLKSLQEYLPRIQALGGSLVAISGESPDRSLTLGEKNSLTYTVLSDPELTSARDFGIVYELPKVVDDAVMKLGFDMRKYYGTPKAELPLSATYVVDRTGVIRYAFVRADYKVRAEPEDILAALAGLH